MEIANCGHADGSQAVDFKGKHFKVLPEDLKATRSHIMPGLTGRAAEDGYDPQRTGYTNSLAQLFIVPW